MLAFFLISLTIIFRLVPYTNNFTPMGAVAVMSGRAFSKPLAIIVVLLSMVISDFALSRIYAYPFLSIISFFVYCALILQMFIGRALKKSKFGSLIAAFIGATSFFIITNFAVWAISGIYQHNFSGLISCYILALPFYKMTLLADLVWTSVISLSCYFYRKHKEPLKEPLKAL